MREVLLDRVVAVVNDEAITQHDLNEQRAAVLVQLRESKVSPPAPDVLERQLLEPRAEDGPEDGSSR